jgi:hypothetical protein
VNDVAPTALVTVLSQIWMTPVCMIKACMVLLLCKLQSVKRVSVNKQSYSSNQAEGNVVDRGNIYLCSFPQNTSRIWDRNDSLIMIRFMPIQIWPVCHVPGPAPAGSFVQNQKRNCLLEENVHVSYGL